MKKEFNFTDEDDSSVTWTYKYDIINKGKKEIKFTFLSPVWMNSISTDNNKIQDIEKGNLSKLDEFAKEKLEATITSKYKSKMKDSFNSYMRIKGFKVFVNSMGEVSIQDLENIDGDITDKEIELYAKEYHQYKGSEGKSREELEAAFKTLFDFTGSKTDEKLKKYSDYQMYHDLIKSKYDWYQEHFKKNFSSSDFRKMLIGTSCSYCGISLEQIDNLRDNKQISSKSGRGFSLEIDRIEPNEEYKKDNCCMACYWCNNAKTDEFNLLDFKAIAKGINCVWKSRGADIIDFEKIEIWKDLKNVNS